MKMSLEARVAALQDQVDRLESVLHVIEANLARHSREGREPIWHALEYVARAFRAGLSGLPERQ